MKPRFGMNVHLGRMELLQLMAAAGFSDVRGDFRWDLYEPEAKGVYHFALMDDLVQNARSLGLSVYPTLGYTPAWANGGLSKDAPPLHTQEWFDAVYAIVSRYKDDIHAWSIWNEPNISFAWSGSIEAYVRLIHEPAVKAIKQADPAAQICGPELSTEHDWESWLKIFLRLAGRSLDVLTVHSYQSSGRETIRRVAGPQTWMMWLKRQTPVRHIMHNAGYGHLPLWVTETGASTAEVSEAEQASYYDQIFELMASGVPIEKLFFFQHIDEPGRDGNDPVRWGILHEDLTPKPAYDVCRARLRTVVGEV